MTISVAVTSRIARAEGSPQLVCGNSGDTVTFSFDAEWDAYQDKTAYFCCIRDGTPQIVSVDFSGSSCGIPVIQAADFVEIGVTAGSIRTTTPARIPCLRCITDIPSVAYAQPRDIYNQLMNALNEVGGK